MQYKDYYKTLGVARNASPDEIKRAYRRLARKYHPDVSKEINAENHFKEINEAHEVLQDPEKRAAYDALGSNWRAGQDFRPPPGTEQQNFHFNFNETSEFSDFFSSIFGRAFGESAQDNRQRKNQDQNVILVIDLEEAYHGSTRQITLETPDTRTSKRRGARERTFNVRIPAGITHGQQIRLAGQGSAHGVLGNTNSDLYLEIQINPHRYFTPQGREILFKLPITPWEAALGAAVTVPTLGGPVSLKIPAGAQTGQKLRLKGRGLPGAPPGDEIVLLEIFTPPANTESAREVYRILAERLPFNPRADLNI